MKFKKNQKVEYVGKGFLGFYKQEKTMTVLVVKNHDVIVEYKGRNMLVFTHEIKPLN